MSGPLTDAAATPYTNHAIDRLNQRLINREEIELTILTPDKLCWPHGYGPIKYTKKINGRVLIVVVDAVSGEVITAYLRYEYFVNADRAGTFPIGDIFEGYDLATA